MRLLLGLTASVALTGCFSFGPPYDRCANGPGLSQPNGYGVYEERKPEAGGPIVAKAPSSYVAPSSFDADTWGASVLSTLPSRSAPDITPRELLVCDLQTVSVAGIDDTAGPYGSKLYRSSTPDLIVWARFDGYALTRGPRSSTTRATFSFPTELHEGDPVVFTFGDHDFFSENDFVAKIQGNYFGKLPFEIKGKGGKANCNAVPLARLEQEAGERRVALESLLVAFEKHVPSLTKPLPGELFGPIGYALTAIKFFAGDANEETEATNERLKAATGQQWATYGRALEKLRSSLPRAGTWVLLDERARARIPTLRCQVDAAQVKRCTPILEIELLKDPDVSVCTAEDSKNLQDPIDSLGDIFAIASDASESSAHAWAVQVGARWLSSTSELWKLKKGDVLRIPLSINGLPESHTRWSIPMIRIGSTYLRVD